MRIEQESACGVVERRGNIKQRRSRTRRCSGPRKAGVAELRRSAAEAWRVIGFHYPTDDFRPGELVSLLAAAPAEVEWDAAALALVCRAGGEVVRLAVEPRMWVNLWVEAAGPKLLAAAEEALVWGCGAAPVVAELPDRLAWVLPLLASDRPGVREAAREVVSGWCESAAAVANQDFEAAGRSRDTALAAAAKLAAAARGTSPDADNAE